MKILVADDDAISRLLMQRFLQDKGFEVLVATDGAEAVRLLLQEDGPRLVLLDWTMPELNGPDVCKAIRSGTRSAYVYITLLTSRDSKQDLVAGLEAGADDYLIKPCHPEELQARLRVGQRILQLEDMLVSSRNAMLQRATYDPLTQMLNRGAILDLFARKLAYARTHMTRFSFMLCDVDHFKRVNDNYGHNVGDEVLSEVGQRLKASVQGEMAGRYGGEEFLLLFPGAGDAEARAAAEWACCSVRTLPIRTACGPLTVTLSAGVVCVGPEHAGMTAQELIREADDLLYQAKREGRNRALMAKAAAREEELAIAVA